MQEGTFVYQFLVAFSKRFRISIVVIFGRIATSVTIPVRRLRFLRKCIAEIDGTHYGTCFSLPVLLSLGVCRASPIRHVDRATLCPNPSL